MPDPIIYCLKVLPAGDPLLIGGRCMLPAGHDGECDPIPLPTLDALTPSARQRVSEALGVLPPGISNELPHLPQTARCPRCYGTGKEASAEDFRGEFAHFVHDADVTLKIVDQGGALFFPAGIALRLKDEFTKATAYDKLVRLLAQGWSINTELVAGDERRAVMLYAPGRKGVFARGMTLEEALGHAPNL